MFQWFPLDFAMQAGLKMSSGAPPDDEEIIVQYLSEYLPPEKAKIITANKLAVKFLEYDWSLNDADAQVTAKTSYALPLIMLQTGDNEVGCECLPKAYADDWRRIRDGVRTAETQPGIVIKMPD